MFRMMRRWAQTFQPKAGEYGSLSPNRAADAVLPTDES